MVNDAYPRDAESIEYSYVGGSKVNMNLCTGNSYVGGRQNQLQEKEMLANLVGLCC